MMNIPFVTTLASNNAYFKRSGTATSALYDKNGNLEEPADDVNYEATLNNTDVIFGSNGNYLKEMKEEKEAKEKKH